MPVLFHFRFRGLSLTRVLDGHAERTDGPGGPHAGSPRFALPGPDNGRFPVRIDSVSDTFLRFEMQLQYDIRILVIFLNTQATMDSSVIFDFWHR